MAFTIPHPVDAIEDPVGVFRQSQWDRKDIEIIVAGFGNVGVISGCAVTAQGTPNMSVHVASGSVMVGGSTTLDIVSVSAGDVTITAAHATLPRFDLIVASNVGALSAVAGTAASTPVFPTIPANRVVLAAVYVPAADTAISTSQIVDKKMPLPTPPAPSSAVWTTVSKPSDQSKNTDTTLANDSALSFSMLANTKYRIRGAIEIDETSGGGGGYKIGHTGPAGFTLIEGIIWSTRMLAATGITSFMNDYATLWFNLNFSGANQQRIMFDTVIHNGATPGTWAIQWAQNTSSADPTIVRGASYIEYGVA